MAALVNDLRSACDWGATDLAQLLVRAEAAREREKDGWSDATTAVAIVCAI
jgi:hypothetical protein